MENDELHFESDRATKARSKAYFALFGITAPTSSRSFDIELVAAPTLPESNTALEDGEKPVPEFPPKTTSRP